ncbi:glycosyltransferase [Pseudoalteromonas sp. SG45-1]|uniref:glycosyltransferase n=1 Tax=Pseudoalteromonas sp. SG45-1 TaxID=2760957 RepID=UPI0015FF20BE|nr:glycosyltransferase [Pseudoalteromonas sp. SG45-1]MBB1402143.1 glycosyltransferase [Pseudoalteromonas sp. SG45-1]
MKGIYLINSLEGGGAERVFSNLVKIQSESETLNSFSVILLDNKKVAYQLPSEIHLNQLNGPRPSLKNLIDFLMLIKKEKPTYVVSFLTRANFFNVLGSLIFGYKSIISERSNTDGRLNKRFYYIKKIVTKLVYGKADKIIAVSKGVENCLIENYFINPKNVVSLHNPVNINMIEKIAKDSNVSITKPYIAVMGRLVTSKCFDVLIDAYALADIKEDLRILGEGPELERLKCKVISLKLEKKIHFMGFQKNPYVYIKNAGFFILPSSLEGFPNALVEAMALKKAVISTNCTDGPSEILKLNQLIPAEEYVETEYGIMINVKDKIGLSKAIRTLSLNESLKNKLAKKSYLRVQDYSPDKFRDKFVEIIVNTLANQNNEKPLI